MKITVCIGSSCHIKGSRQVVEELQKLINEHDLKDKIELAGTFCVGKCQTGVSVMLIKNIFHSRRKRQMTFLRKKCCPG